MNRPLVGLVLLALAGCASVDPAPRSVPEDRPAPTRSPSVYGLLGERDRLDLTSEQVAGLDSIGVWLASETRRVGEALRASGAEVPLAGDDTVARSARRGRAVAPEAAALFEEIATLNRQAMTGVEALLTPEQRTRVCDLSTETERAREESPRRRASRPASARPAWSWCLAAPATAAE